MLRVVKHSFWVYWLACLLCYLPYITAAGNSETYTTEISFQQKSPDKLSEIQEISSLIHTLSSRQDIKSIRLLADSLKLSMTTGRPDSSILGESYYFIGICNLLISKYNESITWLKSAVAVKNNLKLIDEYLANSNYNLAVAYDHLGDFNQMRHYMLEYIRIGKIIKDKYSPEVTSGYIYLVSASIELQEYEKAISYADSAMKIVNYNKSALTQDELSNLYAAIGTCYARLSDYAKARIYYEKAESVLDAKLAGYDDNYINLINNLAIIYGNLGMTAKQYNYYEKGITLAAHNNSALAYHLVYSYAVFLGSTGEIRKGEELLSDLVKKARNYYGTDSRNYIEVLNNYANYLQLHKNDNLNALKAYSDCMNYLKNHDEEVILRDPVVIGYALALSESGESLKALEKIQELLFFGLEMNIKDKIFGNPEMISLKVDRRSLNILKAKHDILWDIYSQTGHFEALEAAANTSELLISLLEKVRINISEEESRLLLGDRYRYSYLVAIRDFELCYRTTQQVRFLEKVFEYMERSKVAGLLAATRELDAAQFHIPAEISELGKSFEREISLYNAKINSENSKDSPDESSISNWNEKVLIATRRRDSLVLELEKKYPDYYAIKYNTSVLKMDEIPKITGRNSNYLNYVVSDSLLYLFLVNRKHQELITLRIDSSFFNKIREFKSLLSIPLPSANARKQFEDYQDIGCDLYKILIEPVRQYFISDKILISPDNILSYLPFETMLSAKYSGTDILYRELQYLMNDFSISYIYSATFMKELVKKDYSGKNGLVAFAPIYSTQTISFDSIFLNRQQKGSGILYDLPYARQEAEYISEITRGKLYVNNEAIESVYKIECPRYDIIHLAMHTYLNDQYPMNSAMIFTQINDIPEDGRLYTYEVYGLPLKARMVVLSSCNTGMGLLFSGEGILSLARGFIYSGSQSVVMSMWEIEDKSGTEVIKMFYDNLKKGNSKSESLKKARAKYLAKANQLTSHPYFWSSLIIYGSNAPLYNSRIYLVAGLSILLIAALTIRYFLKRKYS